MKIITDALDPSFDHCAFDEYRNNSITQEYCLAKNSVGNFATIDSIVLGIFICLASGMISFSIFMFAKGRKVAAFTAQQMMPVSQEKMDAMAPHIGNVAKEVAKGVKDEIKNDKE